MKILMYSTYFPPQYSGAAKQGIALAKYLRDKGHHIEFLTVKWPGLPAKDTFDGFPVHRVEMGRGRRHKEFGLWWDLLKFALKRRRDFDIFHSHGAYYTNSIVGPLAKISGMKSLVKVSLADNDLHGVGQGASGRLHAFLLSMIDRYVSISSEITLELRRLSLDQEKIMEIPNGVDIRRFSPPASEEKNRLRAELGLPRGLMLLYVGGISQRKNVEWLVKTWAEICAKHPDAFLTLVGPVGQQGREEKLYQSLTDFVTAHALEKQIVFREPTPDIERYYQTADIFVLPSKNEGMPNVVLEAMACGLPCLVNRVSGATDLIRDRETGLFFDADSVEDFLCKFQHLSVDPEKMLEVGKSARANIEQRFSLDIVAERYVELYEQVMAE